MSDASGPQGEIALYQIPDGRTRIECRFAEETLPAPEWGHDDSPQEPP